MNTSAKSEHTGNSGFKKEVLEWVKILLAAAAIAFVLNTFIIANSYIPSGSMENTIMTGDRIIGSRLSYAFGAQPQRGDIVLFDHKAEPGKDKTRLVKRIIGLPGETVDIRDNQIYINQSDTPLDEPYLPEPMDSENYHFRFRKAAISCWVTTESFQGCPGLVRPLCSEEAITAKALFRYFPGIRWIS